VVYDVGVTLNVVITDIVFIDTIAPVILLSIAAYEVEIVSVVYISKVDESDLVEGLVNPTSITVKATFAGLPVGNALVNYMLTGLVDITVTNGIPATVDIDLDDREPDVR
jgi:hypothetical protein